MSSKNESLAEKAIASPDLESAASKADDSDNNVDPNIVDWDGPNDPANPPNWSGKMRWSHIIVISLLALVTCVWPIAASIPVAAN